MYEIHTIGGGMYLVDILNAIAAIVSGSAFAAMAAMVVPASVLFLAYKQAFGGSIAETFKWMFVFTTLYCGLMAPTARVNVIDKLNPAMPGVVDNVPFGLAWLASAVSTTGTALTELTEALFALPDDQKYHKTGFVFGDRLEEIATGVEITDTVFAANVGAYIRGCVFPAIQMGRLDPDAFKTATDLWATMTANPSPARMFELRTRNKAGTIDRKLVTCAAGAPILNARWAGEIDDAASIFGLRVFPEASSRPAAKTALLSAIPAVNSYLIGVSRSAADILRQQMLINAAGRAVEDYVAGSGNAAAMTAYTDARAELQASESYRTIGVAARKWVPMLRIVYEALYYGAFPLAFLVMLTPWGLPVFKNYFLGFVWLQSWGPLYAVLHRIMMGVAAERMGAMATMPDGSHGVSIVAQAGVKAIAADVADMAGYLSMSIPFIAFGIARGAQALGVTATSTLHIGQEAASEAAREATTGNISLGNTSQEAHRFNTVEGNRLGTSYDQDTGRASVYGAMGQRIAVNPGGRVALARGSGWSELPQTLNVGNRLSEQWSHQATDSRNLARTQTTAARESEAATLVSGVNLLDTTANAVSRDATWTHGMSATEKESVRNAMQHASQLQEATGLTRDQALIAYLGGSLGMSGSVDVGAFGQELKFDFGGKGGGDIKGSTISKDSWENARKYIHDHGWSHDIDKATAAAVNHAARSGDSETRSLAESYKADLTRSTSLENQAAASWTKAHNFAAMSQYARDHSAAFNQSLAQPFLEWLADRPGPGGAPMGLNRAAEMLYATDATAMAETGVYFDNFVKEVDVTGFVHPPQGPGATDYAAAARNVAAGANVGGTYDADAASVANGGADINRPDLSTVQNQVNRGLRDADARLRREGTPLKRDVDAEADRIKREAGRSAVGRVLGGPGDGNENGGPPGGS